jgi:hypothetical protein
MEQILHSTETNTDREILDEQWRRHNFLEGLYEFYLEKIISFHSFYLPIAGGVVAYVLTRKGGAAAFGLLIPLVISLGAVLIFYLSRPDAEELNSAIHESARKLNIISTHAQLLGRTVSAFFVLHVIIAAGLIAGLISIFHYGGIPGLDIPSEQNLVSWCMRLSRSTSGP